MGHSFQPNFFNFSIENVDYQRIMGLTESAAEFFSNYGNLRNRRCAGLLPGAATPTQDNWIQV